MAARAAPRPSFAGRSLKGRAGPAESLAPISVFTPGAHRGGAVVGACRRARVSLRRDRGWRGSPVMCVCAHTVMHTVLCAVVVRARAGARRGAAKAQHRVCVSPAEPCDDAIREPCPGAWAGRQKLGSEMSDEGEQVLLRCDVLHSGVRGSERARVDLVILRRSLRTISTILR
eukprot:1013536-Prymnesium_polylepis.1